jgi:phosphate uptake regulator
MSELRKVQRTPGGTFFVCVPKSWAEQYGLKKGSVVSCDVTGDGQLLIDTRQGEVAPRTTVLEPGPYLSREIIAKYLLGYDIMRIEGKEHITAETRNVVKTAVGRLVGLEIVEEDYSGIVLQCLLEPSGFPPEKILRRGYAIAASMHRDVTNAFVDGNVLLAKNVVARDDEGNRLYFLLVRILRTIIQNPKLSGKLGVSPIGCLDYRLVASMVEAIGDECVRVAEKTIELKQPLDRDLKKLFLELHGQCFESHEVALEAFLSSDIAMAERTRGMRKKIEATFGEIEETVRSQSVDVVPQILAVASFLRQVFEHSVDISDLAVPKKD